MKFPALRNYLPKTVKITHVLDDNLSMKVWGYFLLFMFMGCQESFKVSNQKMSVNSASISGGRIILSGTHLGSIKTATPTSANLSGYSMEIESKSKTTLTLKLVHASSGALNLVYGTVISFLIADANAGITVNLTVDVTPTGAVMAFNLAACPAGWSAMDGNGGRPDARGRTVIGAGQGAGLTDRTLASIGGSETHTLTIPQIPAHSHNIQASSFGPDDTSPDGFLPNWGLDYYSSSTNMVGSATTVTGSGQPHPIMQPYVALLYCQKD